DVCSSDLPFYFQNLNSSLDARSDTYVNQRGAMTYRGNGWQFQAALHAYELATITSVTPYERLPQLRLDGGHWLGDSGLKVDYRAEYAYFDRELDRGFQVCEDGLNFVAAANPIDRK